MCTTHRSEWSSEARLAQVQTPLPAPSPYAFPYIKWSFLTNQLSLAKSWVPFCLIPQRQVRGCWSLLGPTIGSCASPGPTFPCRWHWPQGQNQVSREVPSPKCANTMNWHQGPASAFQKHFITQEDRPGGVKLLCQPDEQEAPKRVPELGVLRDGN